MTIVGWQIEPDHWEPIPGNPTLTRLDGEQRASLGTVMADSWTWPERWLWGVFEIVDAPEDDIPPDMERVREIFTFDTEHNVIVRGWILEKKPPFTPINRDRPPRVRNAQT